MIKLIELEKHWDTVLGVSVVDLLNRNVHGYLKEEITSLGKEWKKFEEIHTTLGNEEFELYIQCALQGLKKTIERRGFYPSLLVDPKCLEYYQEFREEIRQLWGHPGNRFKDPLFNKMFPTECALVDEYLGVYLKHGEASFQNAVREITSTATGEWLLATLDFPSADLLDPVPRSKYMAARAKSLSEGWDKELPIQKLKAEIHANIIECKKVVGESVETLVVDQESSDPLVVLLAPQVLSIHGVVDSNFRIIHERRNTQVPILSKFSGSNSSGTSTGS